MSIIRDFVELVRNLTANLNLKVDKSSVTSGNTASTVVSRDTSGNFSAGTITANLTGTAANASKLINMNWNWIGQAGQPTWLWGGSDGTSLYVYNPANFNVNYAAQIPSTVGAYMTYAFLMVDILNIQINPGDTYDGSQLTYSGVNNSTVANTAMGAGEVNTRPLGTWRAMGMCVNRSDRRPSTLFIKIG